MSASRDIVKLNVGGRVFETTTLTLKLDGIENFFTALLSERSPTLKDENGIFFIDRDPEYFAIILRFLRTRKLDVPRNVSLYSLHEEALFYSLDCLAEIIMRRIDEPENTEFISIGPKLNGAYVNTSNTKAIVFQTFPGESVEENKIIMIEDHRGSGPEEGGIDAFTQAQVARSASKIPSLWDENNRVEYSEFFCRYIRRGKCMMRTENGATFLTLVVPGTGDNLTQNVMGLLLSLGSELILYSAGSGLFTRYRFFRFGDVPPPS